MLLTNARSPAKGDTRVSRGQHAIDWIETHCVYTVGHWIGQPARLTVWEKLWLMHLLEVDPETSLRRFAWALLGIPKKNGKTELAAWLALYFFLADGEPSPWIACAASAEKQADLVFGAIKRCVTMSPTLSKVCEVLAGEVIADSVPGGKIVRVTSKGGTNDGPSWSVVICDELHEWNGPAGRSLWEVLTNGTGARVQPLIIQITTAGWDLESLLGEQYLYCEALIDNPELDPDYLFWWYTADEKADYRDPKVWKEANPSWGITLPNPIKYLRSQLGKKKESVFRRYFLNQWVEAEDIWLPYGAWDKNAVDELNLDPKLPIYVGIDGALKRDAFAVVGVQPQKGRSVTWARTWENPYRVGDPRRDEWKLDLEEPIAYIRALFEVFMAPAIFDDDLGALPGPAFAYDPRFLEYVAQKLEGEGLNMIEVPQTDERMCPASEATYGEIITGRLNHDGSKRYRRHIQSAVPKYRDRGWRLARPAGSKKPIDAAIALVMAASIAFADNQEPEEEEGPNLWI